MFSNHNTIKLEISSGKKRKWKHVMYRNLYMNVYSSISHNNQKFPKISLTHSSLVGTDTSAMFNRNKQPKSRTYRMAAEFLSLQQMCFIRRYAFHPSESFSQVTAILHPIRQVSIEKPVSEAERGRWRGGINIHVYKYLSLWPWQIHIYLCCMLSFSKTHFQTYT